MRTKKLDAKVKERKLYGCSMDSKAYRMCSSNKNNVIESRDEIFMETPVQLMPTPGEYEGYVSDVREYTFLVDRTSAMHLDIDPNNTKNNLELKRPIACVQELIR